MEHWLKFEGHGFCPVVSVTGYVRYVKRVQSWTRVAYPTRPVASAIGRKLNRPLDASQTQIWNDSALHSLFLSLN